MTDHQDDLYLISPSDYLVMWLKDTMEMISRRPMSGLKHSSTCSDPLMSEIDQRRFLSDLEEKVSSSTKASFVINDAYMSALRDTIRLCNATHVRFYSDGDSVKVVVFDLRKYVDAIGLPLSKNRSVYEKIIKGTNHVPKFSFSMRVETFLKLAENGSDIEILQNGLGIFVGLEENLECFVRDQKIREPLIKFTNEKLDREIVFLPRQKIVRT